MRRINIILQDRQWKKQQFRSNAGFWHHRPNQRAFFDSIASKYKITKPEHWSRVNRRVIMENGGTTILKQHQGSLFNSLNVVYPGKAKEIEALTLQKQIGNVNGFKDFPNITLNIGTVWKINESFSLKLQLRIQ